MEKAQFGSLSPSGSVFTFPPHRRRHLKSETFCTLVRILSHCYGPNQGFQSHQVVQGEPVQDNVEKQFRHATEGQVHGEPVGLSIMEPEALASKRDAPSSEVFRIDECLNGDRMETDEFDHVNRIDRVPIQVDGIKSVKSLEDKNLDGNDVSLTVNQEGQRSFHEIYMKESGDAGQIILDKEHNSCMVNETLDLPLDIDGISESLKPDENDGEGSSLMQRIVSDEVEHEMQLMELEKPEANCGVVNSSPCVTADKEIEEGEILGNFGVFGQSIDLLLEDAASSEDKKVNEKKPSESIVNEEKLMSKQKQTNQEDLAHKNFPETVNHVGNGVELELKENKMSEMECMSETVVFQKNGEAKLGKGFGSLLETGETEKQAKKINEELNHPAVAVQISGGNAAEIQCALSTGKDAGISINRKRGSSSKSKKEKKKEKKRIKRAEKNRQLGVKRLKIRPVLKPKTVSYCRHYIKGRCQEGQNCKFSHDTVPLTKSTPCCHFARHSCMKGDDCPFDHQLSKYPCNNYLSKGSCIRGTDCMFSHEMPLIEGSTSTISISKTESMSQSLPRGTHSVKQLNSHNSSQQKVASKFSSTVNSSCKNAEQNVVESILKPAAHAPNGISRLLFGKSSLGNQNKVNQVRSCPKPDGGVKVGIPFIYGPPSMPQNSNETTKMTSSMELKGINFLSLGKAPLHDSSNDKSSGISLSRDCSVQKSTYSDSSKDKQAASSSKMNDGLKVGNLGDQNTRDMVHNSSEMPKRTLAVPPRGINFLSYGKTPLGDSSDVKLASVPSNRDNEVVLPVQTSDIKLQVATSRPRGLLSSVCSGQSLNPLADEHGKESPSSSLKALLSSTQNSAQKSRLANMPNSAQKALRSTLAFASKYESTIKMNFPAVSADLNREGGGGSSSGSKSRELTILDFLYGDNSKIKQ
ncbi:zinc finger CCCH domain-containing protein 65 [Diospyros lotus]|uniref:zinc finger CCCH domain-containing protein 65 n=1 Tax=Diospyros lotus TaxID=55363 RepID=UPI0022560CED|nr:zinc finger CCCH domain-containing protein 65 [Diospyros lotus]